MSMQQLKITKSIANRESQSLEKYLKEIGKINLITPEEEVLLAKKIKQGDRRALEKLTKANLRFVVSVARQYQNQGLSLSDLINEGNYGLIKAAQKFDETKGFKFISYSTWWIRQYIRRALAEQSRIIRLPLNRVGLSNKISKVYSKLEEEYEREPTAEELAELLDMGPIEIDSTEKEFQVKNEYSYRNEIENSIENIGSLGDFNGLVRRFDLGCDASADIKTQYLPLTIYIDTDQPEVIFTSYTLILDIIGLIRFEKAFELFDIKGSWFKNMIIKSKEAIGSQEVTSRLKEIEYGIEVNKILKPQSEIDKNQSEAILNILKAVELIPNAVIRIGSLLVVKITDSQNVDTAVQIRSLTIQEMYFINKNPDLLTKPNQILIELAQKCNGDKSELDV